MLDALRDRGELAEPLMASFPWSRDYTRDQWLDQLQSHSDHTALAPHVREALFGEIGQVIDGFGGKFTMTFSTVLIRADRA